MDEATALNILSAQCQATLYPFMSTAELLAILDTTLDFSTWKAATPYNYGDKVQPTVRNGHLYRAIVAGTSDTTEPFWPLYTAMDDRTGVTRPHWHGFQGPMPGSQVSDGATLVWVEAGYDGNIQYNIRRATYAAWLQKAAKAVSDYDFQSDRDQYKRSQVHQNCLRMAASYAPSRIA